MDFPVAVGLVSGVFSEYFVWVVRQSSSHRSHFLVKVVARVACVRQEEEQSGLRTAVVAYASSLVQFTGIACWYPHKQAVFLALVSCTTCTCE